jgi:DNA-binding LacI/PurR family transcriptional regulator
MMTGRITSVDVAREAGLSRATVSYVLNGDPRQTIPEVTRQRVLDAARKLGYRPFGPARILRGAKSTLVLMLTPGLEHASDFVAAGIINQLSEALHELGLHLVWQLGSEQDASAAMDLAPAVVLTSSDEGDPILERLRREFTVPVLPAFPGLNPFIASSAVAQVHHLAVRENRTIAYADPEQSDFGPTSEVRWAAVEATAGALGLPAPIRFRLPSSRQLASQELTALLGRHPDVDAICAYNDETAMVILAAAHDAHIDVPARLSVIGVDNHPFGRLSVPALSTVESDTTEFARSFAQYVAATLAGSPAPPVVLPSMAQAVQRAST